jgi:hypothetical protein
MDVVHLKVRGIVGAGRVISHPMSCSLGFFFAALDYLVEYQSLVDKLEPCEHLTPVVGCKHLGYGRAHLVGVRLVGITQTFVDDYECF